MTRQALSKAELEAFHSVLRRAAERAERHRAATGATEPDPHAERLAAELAALAADLAGYGG